MKRGGSALKTGEIISDINEVSLDNSFRDKLIANHDTWVMARDYLSILRQDITRKNVPISLKKLYLNTDWPICTNPENI
jgi:hypothetical protein